MGIHLGTVDRIWPADIRGTSITPCRPPSGPLPLPEQSEVLPLIGFCATWVGPTPRECFGGSFSPQLLESQSQVVSVIALMTGELGATLRPHDPSPPESYHRRYLPRFSCRNAPFIYPHRSSATLPSTRAINVNYAPSRSRSIGLRRNRLSISNLQPRVVPLYTTNQRFSRGHSLWEEAKFWCGIP